MCETCGCNDPSHKHSDGLSHDMKSAKKDKRRRLAVNKTAGAGPISVANMKAQLGPVSSAVLLTQTNIPRGNTKRKKKLFPDVIVKSAHAALDEAIDKLSKNCDNR